MNEREHLENEISKLRYELSVTIPHDMQTAIESGDLRENSEFSDVVSRQYFTSVRLKQLVDRLNSYKAINLQNISKTHVGLGSLVKVQHLEENKTITFKVVVGEIADEPTSEYTEITVNSPIGKALTDKRVKDKFIVILPTTRATYKILDIKTLHDI